MLTTANSIRQQFKQLNLFKKGPYFVEAELVKISKACNTRHNLEVLESMTLDKSARKLTVRHQGFTLQAGLSITNGAAAIPIYECNTYEQ